MKEAIIRIKNDENAILREAADRFIAAWNSGEEAPAVFTFSSPAQMFRVITPKRWELIEHLQKIGPSSIRGLARSLGRDVKRVHEDVAALTEWGLIERTETEQVFVPYDVIHAGFDLTAAA
jgi:predicted transcriptional regulator